MNTVIYARYSAGPRQTDQSIEGQLRVCHEFCKQKGLVVVGEYCDRHISGRTDERPEFQRLIADAKKKKFEAVVVYKTDRFARNKYDSAIYKRELKRNGIQIFCQATFHLRHYSFCSTFHLLNLYISVKGFKEHRLKQPQKH